MIKRVYIEITNICDLSCPFCRKNTRTPSFMDPSFFREILSQALRITDHIYLHVQGEPFLHPQFDEILHICDQAAARVHLVTNGSFLNRCPDLLKHPCLATIAVSMQSVCARPSDTLEDYYSNVIKTAKDASALQSPDIDLRFWRSDTTEDPNTAWCLGQLQKQFMFRDTKRRNSKCILPHVYVSFANDFTWPEITATEADKGTCLGGREQIAVLCDGTVVPCCLDADGKIPLGTLREKTLAEILNTERYLALIRGFEQHRLTEDLCRSCTFRRRFNH